MRGLWTTVMVSLAAAACTAVPGASDTDEGGPGPPEPVHYVALGDSLATGAGAQRGYAERYAERLDRHVDAPVAFDNLARGGWTSADLLDAVRGDPAFVDGLRGADVVTLDIGGNDLLDAQRQALDGTCGGDACLHATVDEFRSNWDAIVMEVQEAAGGDPELLAVDLYNPFVSDLQMRGLLDRLQPFLDAVNDHIAVSADTHDIGVAPVHAAFNGEDGREDPVARGLISDDGLHPSDDGHALIADLLAEQSLRS